MRVKISGMAPGLANVRPPGSPKFANAPPPGTDLACKCPAVALGGCCLLFFRDRDIVIPTVTYCNLVWGTCSPTLLHEVDHIHARAAKIICRLSDVSTQEAITIAGWESINSMNKRKLLTFMYHVYKSELPDNGEAKYQTL